MKTSESLEELFRHDNYRPCFNIRYKSDTGFKSVNLQKGDVLSGNSMPCNNVLMVTGGEINVCCGVFKNRVITEGNMIMILRGSSLCITVTHSTEIMLFGFDMLLNHCDKLRKERLHSYCAEINYDFQPVPIRTQLLSFIGLLKSYLDHNVNCTHLLQCKHCEFFICLDAFYPKREIALLFYPLLVGAIGFRALVSGNFRTTSVKEMIDRSGMGKTRFYETFKKEFGMTAKQWIQKKKVHILQSVVVDPDLSVKEIMHLCGFDDPSLFYRFCIRQFNMPPEKAIVCLRNEIQSISFSSRPEKT